MNSKAVSLVLSFKDIVEIRTLYLKEPVENRYFLFNQLSASTKYFAFLCSFFPSSFLKNLSLEYFPKNKDLPLRMIIVVLSRLKENSFY